jgi:hypothetical protein
MITLQGYAYVGLVYRFASLDRSAEIVKINLEDGNVVNRRWLPAPVYDITTGHPKDEGFRQRGARGVVFADGHVHVATCDTIHVLTPDLGRVETISNEYFCDLHEFMKSPTGYVVTSTRVDSVVWCGENGATNKVWVATDDPALRLADFGIEHVAPPAERDWRRVFPKRNSTHLNAVSSVNGMTLVGLHKQGVLWSIEGGAVFHDARHLSPGNTHNHQCHEDGSVSMNDTGNGRFLHWQPGGELCSVGLSHYGSCLERPASLNVPVALAHGWLRGLARVGKSYWLVGQCPAKLLVVGLQERCVVRVYPIDADWRVSVHGICFAGAVVAARGLPENSFRPILFPTKIPEEPKKIHISSQSPFLPVR